MAYSGRFTPVNLEKYKGDFRKITYRSSWELYVMKFCDTSPHVLKWNSEETIIPYFSNADGKKRRYFVDFFVQMDNGQTYLWEVKPFKETQPPIKPVNLTTSAKKRFIDEVYTWSVNQDKWKATMKVCEQKGWNFRIITEKSLKKYFGFKG